MRGAGTAPHTPGAGLEDEGGGPVHAHVQPAVTTGSAAAEEVPA
ncbi:hypothetical protein [Kineococcus sp. TRM81007]|nr:hypothetical protein [Kineococcus sp. TRM81007]